MFKSIHDPYNANYKRTDPKELDRRLENLSDCLEGFYFLNQNLPQLEKQAKRFDINRVCRNQLEDVKKFAAATDLKYENVIDNNLSQNN